MPDTEVAITRGRHRDLLVTVLNSAGSPQDLTGRTLKFMAKRAIADADPGVIYKFTGSGITHATQSGATLGQATVAIAAADTNIAAVPNYTIALWCEVVLIDNSEPYAVIPDVPPVRFWLLVGPGVINTP